MSQNHFHETVIRTLTREGLHAPRVRRAALAIRGSAIPDKSALESLLAMAVVTTGGLGPLYSEAGALAGSGVRMLPEGSGAIAACNMVDAITSRGHRH